MTETEIKLSKVILEYDNGKKEYIEGEDAEKWLKALNSAITNDFIHGAYAQKALKEIKWKKWSDVND